MSTTALSRPVRIARMLITIATVVYGFIPPVVDLTETHIFHPDWLPHARFHAAWLLGTGAGLALVALYMMWVQRENQVLRIRFAALIGLCVYGGFVLSALTYPLFGGALADVQGGVPTVMGVYGNVIVFLPMFFLVGAGLWLCSRPRSD